MHLPFLYEALALLIGACAGSFVTMASHRLPQEQDIVFKPSHCPHCNATLRFLDLFPILSWTFLKGRCRFCSAPISPRYPLIELTSAGLFLFVYLWFGISLLALAMALLVVILMILIVVDLEHQIIPDSLQVALFLLAIPYHFLLGNSWLNAAIGGAVGLAIGLVLRYGYLWLRKLDALGLGDVKFLLVTGWWLGAGPLVLMLFFAGVMGTVMGLAWSVSGRGQRFPFGPALAAAFFICVIERDALSSIVWIAPLYRLGVLN